MKAQVVSSAETNTYAVHNYTDERVSEVQNSAFGYTGLNNEIMVFFYGVEVIDSYGIALSNNFDVENKAVFWMKNTFIFSMSGSRVSYSDRQDRT